MLNWWSTNIVLRVALVRGSMFLLLSQPWLYDLFRNNIYIKKSILLHRNQTFSIKLCVLWVPHVSSVDILSDSLVPFRNLYCGWHDLLSFSREFCKSHIFFPFPPGYWVFEGGEKRLLIYISIYFLLSRALFKISMFFCFVFFLLPEWHDSIDLLFAILTFPSS